MTPDRLRRVRADQVEALYDGLSVGLVATLAAAVVLYILLVWHGHVSVAAMTGWLIVMVIQTAVRVGLVRAYARRHPPPEDREAWHTAFVVSAFVGGLCWGIGSLLMITPGEFDIQLTVAIVICALVYGSLSGFGSYQPFYALLFPALTPMIVWSAFQGDPRHIAFAILGAIWLPVVALLGYRHEGNVLTSFNLRYENLDLLEDLRVQKNLAEQANVAKSRFLASASHDLRQPVHALGMFVGALKAHDMGAPARRLLGHIEGSIGALDVLFASLLDISRLDAGIITVNKVSFSLQPMLERVCGELRAEAADKGLQLILVPTSVMVNSDPVLLERILRNIIANAVRYTQAGGILVGCRRGAGVRIQIRDTGPGIPDTQRERVFEEFFQIGNPGRDRSQGLGLGLAIVRRLTRLLDHPLRLESSEGKGAMFEITVPAGTDALPLPLPALTAPHVASGLVLVVDDEIAVCEAMRSLLESWGHEVITAGSGRQMLQQMANIGRPPALIISDYRLQNGENGIDVIRNLQSEFNDEIPAMLITGDTAADRLVEARASGFLLLHKPLSAERLRAAIGSITTPAIA
jgi:signal transduction histidine kinase/ActR/RegA family two-component response regulator